MNRSEEVGRKVVKVLVEEYGRFENLVFQKEGGERTIINDFNEAFHEVPKELQKRGEVLVLAGVDIGKDVICG